MFNNKKVSKLVDLNEELVSKTNVLKKENIAITEKLNFLGANIEFFTGETTSDELGAFKEVYICYELLRLRSWEFITKNHIAKLIVNKRVNWQIGSGLLFQSVADQRPFIEYYGKEVGESKHREFITNIEYEYRNFINSKLCDYSNNKNLHELAREIDFNACGDGDILVIMRVKNGYPNLQAISGQNLINPFELEKEIPKGNTICDGVEKNSKGNIVAYHVSEEISDRAVIYDTQDLKIGTKRISAYFKNTNIRQAWLYKASDLQKLGEVRSMPLLSSVFETLKHVNDYLIANAKNAQLLAQMVFFLEKDQNSDGERVFATGQTLDGLGMSVPTDTDLTDELTTVSANKAEMKLKGNGIVMDLPRGVKAKILNPESQSNQADYLESTLKTLFAEGGTPQEVMLSSYNSNYTASMGARGDFQHVLDVNTEIITASQLYRKHYEMFVYLAVLTGRIECKPLFEAYTNNDEINIQSIIKSKFEGTKLKPIDPIKFIKSLRAQIPEKYREDIPLNTLEKLVNDASNGDYDNVVKQVETETMNFPESLKEEDETVQVQQSGL